MFEPGDDVVFALDLGEYGTRRGRGVVVAVEATATDLLRRYALRVTESPDYETGALVRALGSELH